MNPRVLAAEGLGSFAILLFFFAAWLPLSAGPPDPLLPAGIVGLATMALSYGLGQISGGHFNPAVTIGLVAGGRFELAHAPAFILAHLLGAALAATAVVLVGFDMAASDDGAVGSFSAIANHAGGPGETSVPAALAIEAVLTALLVIVFMGATAHSALAPLAPLAIGAVLTLCYIVAMPLTKAGLNPARSTAAALFAGAEFLAQLWIFWLAPLVGACIGGLTARYLLK